MPNTSGARNADEAVRLARLAASAGLPNWVKLEIHPDPRYLLPDPVETLAAAEILVKEGFTVLPYINADPVLAKRLQDVGFATVMPLGSPIGSNRGIETRAQIEIIIEQATVPVVVDAGLGAPSHAAEAMEMGADAVLVNTAIAIASDPVRMAQAFRKGDRSRPRSLRNRAGRKTFDRGGDESANRISHAIVISYRDLGVRRIQISFLLSLRQRRCKIRSGDRRRAAPRTSHVRRQIGEAALQSLTARFWTQLDA